MLNIDDETMLYAMIDIIRSSIDQTVKVVDDTLTAVTQLAKHSETEIHQTVSEGRLSEIFPYEVSGANLPAPELKKWSDVVTQRDSMDESKTSTK